MANQTLPLDQRLYEYLLANSLREPELLRRLRAETAKLPCADLQISPEQGQFMALLIELLGARKALEIGTFTGYSALWVALALPADGRLLACDVSAEWTAVARRYWAQAGLEHKIELRLAPALETLEALPASELGTYDFIFIDADKGNYDPYYEAALALLRPGGLIALDNTLRGGKVADPAAADPDTLVMRALNVKIHGDERVSASLVPIADGLTLARKR